MFTVPHCDKCGISSFISATELEIKMEPRFALVHEEELEQLLDDKDSTSTKHVLKQAYVIFGSYCTARGIDIEKVDGDFTERELCECLRSFYAEVRRTNGELYAKRSMITIQYGLQRHFLKTKSIDIVNGEEFKRANYIFAAVFTVLNKQGTN